MKKNKNSSYKFTLILFFLLGACSSSQYIRFTNNFVLKRGEPSKNARIFLIAGSRDSANFAQEISNQKKYFLKQGYSADQIECYALPLLTEKKAKDQSDYKQYLNIKNSLKECFFADPQMILDHISKANQESDFVYVYISSHGTPPFRQLKFKQMNAKLHLLLENKDWSDNYVLTVEGRLADKLKNDYRLYSDLEKFLIFSEEHPNSADEYLLTAHGLRQALSSLPEKMKKIVVLQACHSGGFILPAKVVGAEKTLQSVKNIEVLTASSADSVSFGCQPGNVTTFFGDAYFENLKTHYATTGLSSVDWKKVFVDTRSKVQFVEKNEFDGKVNSEPQYFKN